MISMEKIKEGKKRCSGNLEPPKRNRPKRRPMPQKQVSVTKKVLINLINNVRRMKTKESEEALMEFDLDRK